MYCVSKYDVINQLLIVADSKSRIVTIAINVVGIDAIAAFVSSLFPHPAVEIPNSPHQTAST